MSEMGVSDDEADDDADYEVGYGRPPKHTQFKKGQSGNPKGRPKGSKNLITDISEEALERIVLREGGKVIKVSKQRALIKSVWAKALNGNIQAAKAIFDQLQRAIDAERDKTDAGAELNAEELDLLDLLSSRAKAIRALDDGDS